MAATSSIDRGVQGCKAQTLDNTGDVGGTGKVDFGRSSGMKPLETTLDGEVVVIRVEQVRHEGGIMFGRSRDMYIVAAQGAGPRVPRKFLRQELFPKGWRNQEFYFFYVHEIQKSPNKYDRHSYRHTGLVRCGDLNLVNHFVDSSHAVFGGPALQAIHLETARLALGRK